MMAVASSPKKKLTGGTVHLRMRAALYRRSCLEVSHASVSIDASKPKTCCSVPNHAFFATLARITDVTEKTYRSCGYHNVDKMT